MSQEANKHLTYYVLTYGCQMNVYDSEILAALMENEGYLPAAAPEDADIVIFNTCCIRDNADQKVYGRLGDFKKRRETNANFVLAVAGCLAQKDKEGILQRFPQIDIVLGTHQVRRLPELIKQVLVKRQALACVDRVGDHLDMPARPLSAFQAKIPISVGCNQWCTYCIVPYVRGPLKSRPLPLIKAEAQRLAAEGWREIMLLGQNVNDYGHDLEEDVDFATVLRELKGIPGLDRLRFTSPHPAYFTDRVIEAMADNPSVCEHVHLPLQSGDDEILRKMKRGYTGDEFLQLTAKLRQAIPNLGITTDIIVGYANESEEQFENTLRVVEEAQFDSAFMFAYSERPGTPGALAAAQVPEEVRMERLYKLIAKQNAISEAKHRTRLKQVTEVLAEGPSKKEKGRYTGRTRQNWLVHFPCDVDLTGSLVRVELEEAYMWGFVGKMLEVVG